MDKKVLDWLIYLLSKSYYTEIRLRGFYNDDMYDMADKYDEFIGLQEFSYDVDNKHGGTGVLKIKLASMEGYDGYGRYSR